MRKIFIVLFALFLITGFSTNDAFAKKGVKYKGGSVSGGGTIEGKVFFKGEKPPHMEIIKEKNPEICGKGVRIIDPWTLGSDGELLEAVVYILDIKTGKKWTTDEFKFEQKGCAFVPYLSIMRNGKKVEVVNLDPIGHNIHTYEYIGEVALSKLKPGGITMTKLNIGQPNQGFTFKKKIKLRKDNQMKMECDIHNFMHGWMLALENPYYSVTKADGGFKIDNVPAGTYKVIAWHPTFGVQEQSVTVKDGASQSAMFELKM